MKEDVELLKDWTFKIDEISANVYRVQGVDSLGRSVERTGTNPEKLLADCKTDALELCNPNHSET